MMPVAQRLRQKLLDLAIHGKLVPQCAKDEPAGELLTRIRTARSAAGRTRTPTALHPIPEEEVPFDLPSGWAWCRLGEIFKFIDYRGKTPNKISKGIRLITARNVRMGYVDYSIKDFISREEFAERQSRGIAHRGDILFTTEAPLGFVAIADCDEFSTGQRLITFQQYNGTEEFLNQLIAYFLQSPAWQKLLYEKKTGTTVAGIKAEYLRQIVVPMPPLAEQKRIVEKLDGMLNEATRVAEGTERLAQLRKKARAKILDLAIRGKLVQQEKSDEPATELLKRIAAEKAKLVAEKKIRKEKPLPPIAEGEMPFDLPKGWAWCRFRELGVLTGGHTPSMRNPKFWGGDVLWVTSKDMKRKFIDDTGAKITKLGAEELTMLKPGAVLMCTRSGILRRTFPVAIATKELTINQDQRALTPFVVEMSEYVYMVLCAFEPMILADYRKTGTTVESIIWEKFIDMPIPLPPLAEQRRVVAKVKEMLAACDALGGEG